MSTADTFQQHVLPTYGRFPLAPVRGEGCHLWDETGKRYLDFCIGIAVCSLGHCHPRIVAAIREQAGKPLGICFWREAPERAIEPVRRAGKWGMRGKRGVWVELKC